MKQPSSISRRMQDAVSAYIKNDYEGCFVHLFPAIDKTAKLRRPSGKVGERVRAFLTDQEDIISAIATGNVLKGIYNNGASIPDALYKFGRNSIAHEGELDPRLEINNTGSLQIGEKWDLPSYYIFGMCIAAICASENNNEQLTNTDWTVTIFKKQWKINELWGTELVLRGYISTHFSRPPPPRLQTPFTWPA